MNKRIAKKSGNRVTKSSLNKENIRLKKQILMLDQMISESVKVNHGLEKSIDKKTEEILRLQDNIVQLGYINTASSNAIEQFKKQLIIGDSIIDKKEEKILTLQEEIYRLKNEIEERANMGFFKRLFA